MKERAAGRYTRIRLVSLAALACLGLFQLACEPAGASSHRTKLEAKFKVVGKVLKATGFVGQPKSKGFSPNKVQLEEMTASGWTSRTSLKLDRPKRRASHFVLTWVPPSTQKIATVRVKALRNKRSVAVFPATRIKLNGHPTKPEDPPSNPSTVVSNGGVTTVGIDGITVVAPAGSIAAGQTLSVKSTTNGNFPDPPAPSIGGTYQVTTSQGEPSRPVTVALAYDGSQLAPGELPTIIHGMSELDSWIPEQTSITQAPGVATAQIDSFSLLSVVGNWSMAVTQGVTWLAGNLTGNRSSKATGCASSDTFPTWIENVYTPNGLNDSLPTCIGSESGSQTVYLHVANNRGYLQTVELTNAKLNVSKSAWSDSLEGQIGQRMASLGSSGPSSFLLAPGSNAVVAIDKSAVQGDDDRTVKVKSAPEGSSAAGMIGWSLLKQTTGSLKKLGLGLPVDTFNCIVGVLYQTVQGETGAGSISRMKTCVDAAAGMSGLAKTVLTKIAAATLVTDLFYKLIDIETDEAFPPSAEFTVTANPWHPDDPAEGTQLIATSVSAGAGHACAIRPSGQAVCWGDNGAGELGDGTTSSSSTPVSVAGLADAKSIDAGQEFTCAVRTSGQVVCWGKNDFGQLGDGTTVDHSTPMSVPGLENATHIAVGQDHVCATRSAGQVVCWGANNEGQVTAVDGPPVLTPSTFFPVDSPYYASHEHSGYHAIASGSKYTCLIYDGNSFYDPLWRDKISCWGWGGGPNGDGLGIDGERANAISVGYDYGVSEALACAAYQSGLASCWGPDSYGETGRGGLNGSFFDDQTPVEGIHDAKSVAAGAGFACALRNTGQVSCWGRNTFGSLGNGSTDNNVHPAPVQGLSDVKVVSAGPFYACAIETSGKVFCWGEANHGQLGDGHSGYDLIEDSPVPVAKGS